MEVTIDVPEREVTELTRKAPRAILVRFDAVAEYEEFPARVKEFATETDPTGRLLRRSAGRLAAGALPTPSGLDATATLTEAASTESWSLDANGNWTERGRGIPGGEQVVAITTDSLNQKTPCKFLYIPSAARATTD